MVLLEAVVLAAELQQVKVALSQTPLWSVMVLLALEPRMSFD